MIIKKEMTCEKCGKTFEDFMQYAYSACRKCGKRFLLCPDCKKTFQCDWCGCTEFVKAENNMRDGQQVFF